MNNGTNNFQNFIGISSLQKTLRNALIPTETTQQFIVKNGIIKEDELRGENRQILKDISWMIITEVSFQKLYRQLMILTGLLYLRKWKFS